MKDYQDLYLEEIHRKLVEDPEELRRLRMKIREYEEEYYLKTKQDEIRQRRI